MSYSPYSNETAQSLTLTFDFRQGLWGWEAGFADYAVDQSDLRLEAGLRKLPPELEVAGSGFYIQGNNRSDDLFMFLKRRLSVQDGIQADQSYQVNFKLTFASNAPSDCFGIGGAPGESVILKAGAAPVEPNPVLDADDHFRMNVDKGNQTQGGVSASVVGNIANGIPCSTVVDSSDAPYVSLQRTHRHDPLVIANSSGELWLLIGTDSGFEGLTALYYQEVAVELIPMKSKCH